MTQIFTILEQKPLFQTNGHVYGYETIRTLKNAYSDRSKALEIVNQLNSWQSRKPGSRATSDVFNKWWSTCPVEDPPTCSRTYVYEVRALNLVN